MNVSERRIQEQLDLGLHLKDARNLDEILQGKIVDVTITSPPYFDLKDYGYGNQIGYGQTWESYMNDLQGVFRKVYDVTKETGSLWIIIDNFKWKHNGENPEHAIQRENPPFRKGELVPLPFYLTEKLRQVGWILRDIIVWKKDKTLPWSRKGQLRNIFEYILFFTKTDDYKFYVDNVRIPDVAKFKEWWVKFPERYNPRGIVPTDVWSFSIPVQGSWVNGHLRHANPLPYSLVERIILLTTDQGRDVVLDPFSGSGVVLATSEFLKRRAIGFELSIDYVTRYRESVRAEIINEMREEAKKVGSLSAMSQNLDERIRALRLIKYPKTLIATLIKSGKISRSSPINSIFCTGGQLKKNTLTASEERFKILTEEIHLVFDSITETQGFQTIANKTANKAPLSGFGIIPSFFVYTIDQFRISARFPKNRDLYLYSRGLVNYYKEKTTFEEWVTRSRTSNWRNLSRNGIPPILSDIPVRERALRLTRGNATIDDGYS
jgi:DNA modification methylase